MGITVLIGSAGSGKTTWVLEHYKPVKTRIDLVPITDTEQGAVLVGDYTKNRRELGTDTISYNALDKIIKEIEKLDNNGIPVVVEGDRINNQRFFEFLKTRKNVKLYLVLTDLKTASLRLKRAESKISHSFLKTTYTKSIKNFAKYRGFFDSGIIYT
jgi:predicted ABC-type ATPase